MQALHTTVVSRQSVIKPSLTTLRPVEIAQKEKKIDKVRQFKIYTKKKKGFNPDYAHPILFKVTDDAMVSEKYSGETISAGSQVLAQWGETIVDYHQVLAATLEGLIVRTLRWKKKEWVLEALNSKYPDIPVTKDVHILGLVYDSYDSVD